MHFWYLEIYRVLSRYRVFCHYIDGSRISKPFRAFLIWLLTPMRQICCKISRISTNMTRNWQYFQAKRQYVFIFFLEKCLKVLSFRYVALSEHKKVFNISGNKIIDTACSRTVVLVLFMTSFFRNSRICKEINVIHTDFGRVLL